MSDDALAQAILNPTSSGDGFGPERRSKGEEVESNDLEIQEATTEDELGSDLDSQDEINDQDDDSYNPNNKNRSKSNNNNNKNKQSSVGYTSAQRRIQSSNARTGPKGVLRDRHESDQKALKLQKELLNQRNGKKSDFSTLTLDEEDRLKRKLERESMRKRGEIDSDDDDDEEKVNKGAIVGNDNEDGIEEKELKSLREKRLKELRESQIKTQALQQQRRRGLMSGAQSTGRWFGHLREVDEKGFVKAVEEDGEGTSVVVHIYGKVS